MGVGWGGVCVELVLLLLSGLWTRTVFVSVSCLLFGTTSNRCRSSFSRCAFGRKGTGSLSSRCGLLRRLLFRMLFHTFIQGIRNLRSAVALASSVSPIPLALAIMLLRDLFLKKRNIYRTNGLKNATVVAGVIVVAAVGVGVVAVVVDVDVCCRC